MNQKREAYGPLSGYAWPNSQNYALTAYTLLSGSESGRGFGSVFHHHIWVWPRQQTPQWPRIGNDAGPFFFLQQRRSRSGSVGGGRHESRCAKPRFAGSERRPAFDLPLA